MDVDGSKYPDGLPVGLLARLSTSKDSKELTELGFERQYERSAAFCTAKGWKVVKLYQDLGSAFRKTGMATAPRRSDFERALRDVEAGVIKGIVFFKLDRFCRDHGDFERALAVAEKHSAVLASVTEPLDTSTPMGEAVARLLVTFARMESQMIALRVAAQAEQQAFLGQPWRGGRYRAYGYEAPIRDEHGQVINRDRVGIEIVEEEAAVIREIADRLLTGQSEGAVVRWLNELETPAPAGGTWNRAKLRSLLTNPRLAGGRRYHGEVVAKGVWTAILDEDTFDRLCRLFAQRAKPGRPPTRWLLSGIIYCALCKAHLETRGHQAGTRYVCDRQSRRSGQTKPSCGRVGIVAAPLDELVAEMVIQRLAGPALANLDQKLASTEHRQVAEQRRRDEEALVEAARQRFVLQDADGKPTLQPRAYAEVKAELDKRIAAADRRLSEDEAIGALIGLPRLEEELREYWEKADIERRREITRAILDRVMVSPATRRGAGIDPDRIDPRWKL